MQTELGAKIITSLANELEKATQKELLSVACYVRLLNAFQPAQLPEGAAFA